MLTRISKNLKTCGALAFAAATLAACHSTPTPPTEPEIPPPLPPQKQKYSTQPTPVPRMGVVTEVIAGHPRLFSTFGFWMMNEPLKTQLLACFRPDGTLDRVKLRQMLPDAKIVEGPKIVAVQLEAGTFTFFLLRDGPLISLDPKFDSMVQQMSVKAYTTP